jgi:hypothetical protein
VIEQIKEHLEKIKNANWTPTKEDGYTFMSIMGNESVTFDSKAPEYVRYLISEVERLGKALEETKELIPELLDEYESPNTRHNLGVMIMWRIDQALKGETK